MARQVQSPRQSASLVPRLLTERTSREKVRSETSPDAFFPAYKVRCSSPSWLQHNLSFRYGLREGIRFVFLSNLCCDHNMLRRNKYLSDLSLPPPSLHSPSLPPPVEPATPCLSSSHDSIMACQKHQVNNERVRSKSQTGVATGWRVGSACVRYQISEWSTTSTTSTTSFTSSPESSDWRQTLGRQAGPSLSQRQAGQYISKLFGNCETVRGM